LRRHPRSPEVDRRRCGLFGSLSGIGHTAVALLARRSVRRFGARGHTLLATASCAATDLALALGSTRVAFAALPVNWVGRTQGMAVTARLTTAGAAAGFGQGSLAGDHQNLRSLLKVVGPTLYGYLFGLGCSVGVPALPFLFATAVSLSATALVLASPSHVWDPPPQPPPACDAGGGGGSGSGDLAAGSGGAGGSERGGGTGS